MMKARPARSVRARRTPRRATAGVRSGGRSARIVAAVLDAAIDALSRASYAAVSIEDVAAAAGVNKTTVYRRWPTRAALVGAALARLAAAPEAADTGALES